MSSCARPHPQVNLCVRGQEIPAIGDIVSLSASVFRDKQLIILGRLSGTSLQTSFRESANGRNHYLSADTTRQGQPPDSWPKHNHLSASKQLMRNLVVILILDNSELAE